MAGMKVVILAGGFGSRITEESITKPKPLVEIGGAPIFLHRRKDHDGRADQARPAVPRRWAVLPDLRRWSRRHQHSEPDRIPPAIRSARDGFGGAPARALRRTEPDARRVPRVRLPREVERGRRLY